MKKYVGNIVITPFKPRQFVNNTGYLYIDFDSKSISVYDSSGNGGQITGGSGGITIQEVQQLISVKADKATTLAGYSISDAYTKAQTDQKFISVDSHISDTGIHVTANQKALWNAKANAADVYTKSQIEAKNYLTQHQDISAKADKATTLAGYSISDAYTKSEVDSRISQLISGAPETLDTLQQIAAALSGDANFAQTVLNQIGLKADSSDVYTIAQADQKFLTQHQSISGKADKAVTLAGYGITDAYTIAQTDSLIAPVSAHTLDSNIHVSTADKTLWNSKADGNELSAHVQNIDMHITVSQRAQWNSMISGKADKSQLFSKSYNDLIDIPDIPAKISDLENDSEFVTSSCLTGYVSLGITGKLTVGNRSMFLQTKLEQKNAGKNISIEITSGGVLEIANTLSGVSQLQNDAGYLTQHQDISSKLDKVQPGYAEEVITAAEDGTIKTSGKTVGPYQLGVQKIIDMNQLAQNIKDQIGISDQNFNIKLAKTKMFGSLIPIQCVQINSYNGQFVRLAHSFNSPVWNRYKYDGDCTFTYHKQQEVLSAQLLSTALALDWSISKAGVDEINGTQPSVSSFIQIKTLDDNKIHTFAYGKFFTAYDDNIIATQKSVLAELSKKADVSVFNSHTANISAHISDSQRSNWNQSIDRINQINSIDCSETFNTITNKINNIG